MADIDDLIHRIVTSKREVTFLFGSALTAGNPPHYAGVWSVAEVVDELRHLVSHYAGPTALPLGHTSGEEYRNGFAQVLRGYGQDRCNEVIHTAVSAAHRGLDAVRLANVLSDDVAYDDLIETPSGWHTLSPAVYALGTLLTDGRRKYRRVLTTNFDPLIEVAISRAGGSHHLIALDNDGTFHNMHGSGTQIVHVHGHWRYSDTLHTEVQLATPRPHLMAALQACLARRLMVVLGYGGWDDVLMTSLRNLLSHGVDKPDIAWGFYKDPDPTVTSCLPTLAGRVQFFSHINLHDLLPRLLAAQQAAWLTPAPVASPSMSRPMVLVPSSTDAAVVPVGPAANASGHVVATKQRAWIYRPLHGQIELAKRGQFLTVDDSALVFASVGTTVEPDGSARFLRKGEIVDSWAPRKDPLVSPSANEVAQALEEASVSDAVKVFLNTTVTPFAETFRAKVRIARLQVPDAASGPGLRLYVTPYSQLIERQFNRRLLSDAKLSDDALNVYEGALQAVLSGMDEQDSILFPAPGVLFIETCVVTADNEILLFKKLPSSGSTFAKIGRPWTCGGEVSVDWASLARHYEPDWAKLSQRKTAPTTLDTGKLLFAALEREIGVTEDDIETIWWHGIAVECHLNTALLATVRTHLNYADLRSALKRASNPPGDLDSTRAVQGLEAAARVFGASHLPQDPDWPQECNWHTSARMRVLLALRAIHGVRAAHELIDTALGERVPWSDR